MIKIYLALFVAVFFFSQLNAQEATVDSLKTELAKTTEDTSKVNILNKISYLLFTIDPEESRKYALEAKENSEQIQYVKGLAYANKNIGLTYYMQGDFIQVLTYWEKSLKDLEEIKDRAGEANLLANIGAVYRAFGDDGLALKYFFKSLDIAEDIDDEYRVFSALVNIGSIYDSKPETYDAALKIYRRTVLIVEAAGNSNDRGSLFSNYGELFLKLKQYDSAYYYLNKALVEFEGTTNYPVALNLIGRLYVEQEQINKAIDIQKQAIQISSDADNKNAQAQSLLGLGNSYLQIKNYESALKILKEAEILAKDLGTPEYIKDVNNALSKAYYGLNQFDQAYLHKELYAMWKDTVYNVQVNDEIASLKLNYELGQKQDEIDLLAADNVIQQLETKRQLAISWGAGIIGFLLLILALGIFRRYKFIKRIKAILEKEKGRSDNLLLNILPAETAEELKEKGSTESKYYESASILFTDFKDFTIISANMTPKQLVSDLHECFQMFDIITSRYGLEKIKTIGDAYMAAGGLPKVNNTHPDNVAMAALEIRNYMEKLRTKREREKMPFFEVRIGIHTGPVVAGVVGIKKFAYDIWGDTVNIAARMESSSEPGKVNISESTYQLVKDKFDCEYRGEIEAKNRGILKMYFLKELKEGELEPMVFESEAEHLA